MKICKVIIPFIDKVTGEFHKENDEVLLSDERISEIKTVNTNMVYVIGEAPEAPEVPEVTEVPEIEPEKKPRKKKND